MQLRYLTAALCSVGLATIPSEAAIVAYTLVSGHYADVNGVRVNDGAGGTGTLFQLVNLGADGIFNEINVGDGSASPLSQWVSGDDVLLNVALLGTIEQPTDYATTSAFDLVNGDTANAGQLNRVLRFDIPTGTKFGIRWFPGIAVGNFATTTLTAGQQYGQFTRQDDLMQTGPFYDGALFVGTSLWVGGADGSFLTLDPMRTPSAGGTDDGNAIANAPLTVINVPEPASLGLALLGTLGIFSLRRRR